MYVLELYACENDLYVRIISVTTTPITTTTPAATTCKYM